MTTQYLETKIDREFTKEEIIGLVTRTLKPYPDSWYTNEKSIIVKNNRNHYVNYQTLDLNDCDDVDFSEFSCPVNKYEYLVCNI